MFEGKQFIISQSMAEVSPGQIESTEVVRGQGRVFERVAGAMVPPSSAGPGYLMVAGVEQVLRPGQKPIWLLGEAEFDDVDHLLTAASQALGFYRAAWVYCRRTPELSAFIDEYNRGATSNRLARLITRHPPYIDQHEGLLHFYLSKLRSTLLQGQRLVYWENDSPAVMSLSSLPSDVTRLKDVDAPVPACFAYLITGLVAETERFRYVFKPRPAVGASTLRR